MAKGVTPECRYGHGPLKLHPIPNVTSEDDGLDRAYFTSTIFADRIDFGTGYAFEIWECEKCSYIELHDVPPVVKKKIAP